MSEASKPRPLRVFVVENHPDTLKWLTIYLEGFGHTVVSAKTVAESLERFPTADCEVLICDIGLPDGTGWDLLKKLPRERPFYAIAMSGFGRNADSARSREAGFREHVLKPFEPKKMIALLEQASRRPEG